MNILFALSNGSCSYILNACEKLLNKKEIIAFYCSEKLSNDNYVNLKNFVKKNKVKIFFYNELNKIDKYIDHKYLNYIEEKLNINIWKSISVDRSLGRSYIQDLDGYKSKYTTKNQILSVSIKKLKFIEKTISNFKPDVVFWPTVVASYESVIFDKICSNHKIKFLTAIPYRIKNFFFYAKDMFYKYPDIENKYNRTKIKKKNINRVNKLFKEITQPGKMSSDAKYVSEAVNRLNYSFLKSIFIFLKFFLKHLIAFLLFKFNIKVFKLSYHKKYEFFDPLIEKYKLLSSFHYLKKFKYKDLKCNYIYYPLHRTPEGSTQLNGNTFMDQFFLIQSLSKNLPINYKLLIKEHPSMIEAHSRGKKFYEEISRLPNVEIVDFKISGTKLVKNAKLIVILDGSSAVEAMLLGVPILTMSYFLYDFLGFSVSNYSISNLNEDIKKGINLKKKLSRKKGEKKIKKLLHFIMNESYDLKEPETFYYTNINPTKKSLETTGEDFYQSIISELNIK